MAVHPGQFEPIEQRRAHEYVAEQLRRQIALRLVAEGDALPPERTLMKLFGVGRATVQRAVGALQREGLVERRRGRTGGTFVTLRGPRSALADELRLRRAELEQALEFRAELEPGVAARVAAHATARDVAALRRVHRALAASTTDDAFDRRDTEFHLLLARQTRNPLFVEAVERVRMRMHVALRALPESPLWLERTLHDHEAIVDAIEAGDAELARAAMRAHVSRTDRSVHALLGSIARPRRSRARPR